jgi:hypothetical protein
MRQLRHKVTTSLQPCRSVLPRRPPDPFDAVAKATGLKLPDDLRTVLGDSVVATYGGLALNGTPKIGLRTHPSDLSAAQQVVHRLQARLGRSAGFPLAVDTAGSDLLVGTSGDYLADLAKPGGFGAVPQVQLALGDLPAQVSALAYVVPPDVIHLKAVGLWAGASGSTQIGQLRLVVG